MTTTFGPSAYLMAKAEADSSHLLKQNGALPKQYSSVLLLSAKATDVDVHAAELSLSKVYQRPF